MSRVDLKDQVLHIGDLTPTPAKLRTLRAVRRVAGEIIEFLAQLRRSSVACSRSASSSSAPTGSADQGRPSRALARGPGERGAARGVAHALPHRSGEGPVQPQGGGERGVPRGASQLVVDTRHFDQDFVDRLLEGFDGDLDDAVGGILIHGENYQALRLLERKYAGAVKCIYIDPPYNTGSDDFIYKDRYRHSSWLAMMEERLRVARGLLAEDGAIFVSIDDNEQASLKRLLDEVFGSENFIDTIIWQKVYAPKSSARHFSSDHDFIVAHARHAELWTPNLLPRTEAANARYTNEDNDPRGPWKPGDLTARNYYSKGLYEVASPSGKVFRPPSGRYWAIPEKRFKELNDDGRIWWGPKGDNMPALNGFFRKCAKASSPQNLWLYKDVGHTQEAKRSSWRSWISSATRMCSTR